MLSSQRHGNSAYRDVPGIYTHIADPNERRRMALAEVDKAPFGWYHVRLVVVTGIGFFTDAYSLFAINLASIMLGIVYWQDSNGGVMPHGADTAIKVATSAGAILGQFVFGFLADLLGRKRMYGVELMIIISATLAQSLCGSSTALSFVGVIIFYRVVMGIGVGGDYPLSAVITAEFASTKYRGGIVAAVFAMQGLGQLAASLMAFILVIGYRKELEPVRLVADCTGECGATVDRMWRFLIGFGGIPGWFALYYRLTIPETPRYTFDVLYDVEKAAMDARRYRFGKEGNGLNPYQLAHSRQEMAKYRTPRPTVGEALRYFCQKTNAIKLLGTSFSWFFLDLAFYGIGLSSPSLLSVMGFDKKTNVYENLKNTATGQLVLICAGAIPGYWMTVFTVDKLGRKPIQIGGFAILTIIFCILGFAYNELSQRHLLALYVLAQFFFNFGPNATTFITPAEIFPTRVRSTGHGISAGMGKLGAVIAQTVFAPMIKKGATHDNPTPWIHGVMQIFALFMFLGMLTSLLIPEGKGQSLEELAGEKHDVYELQFRSGFFGGERGGRGRGGGRAGMGRGRDSDETHRWWKLG
ncbi:major facilitator superfamily domain-containing protein [Clohesyomyces aquaticus]|uniref:Major facilitator superfamily domain-containing protein n=1 Tax=Clohesyomyces aquaticus TaxID=1231657 RepID=A0A1Y1ZNX2_9PLEO|nr:major facilitator superfamily domain-containing protein [Clohesyomyces aquaticus]